MAKYELNVEEGKGNLPFCVQWISLDGRLNSNWYPTLDDAIRQRDWLRKLWNSSNRISLLVSIDDVNLTKIK
ncbi:MAG: hypothetical protein WC444_05650 [Candidatus Paceibacterota bacterium]